MANMFSNKEEKSSPKTLYECTKPDATVSNLHKWAERLETWGKILFWVLIAWGIASAILVSTTVVVEESRYSSKEIVNFDFELFFVALGETAFYAFLEYCAYHVLALMISSHALITQNTIISANVALFQANKKPEGSAGAAKTAAAGAAETVEKKPVAAPNTASVAPNVGSWECKVCGATNSLNYGQCKKCGKFRS